jgi:hypothetical protein
VNGLYRKIRLWRLANQIAGTEEGREITAQASKKKNPIQGTRGRLGHERARKKSGTSKGRKECGIKRSLVHGEFYSALPGVNKELS